MYIMYLWTVKSCNLAVCWSKNEAGSRQNRLWDSAGRKAGHGKRWWETYSAWAPITGTGYRKITEDKCLQRNSVQKTSPGLKQHFSAKRGKRDDHKNVQNLDPVRVQLWDSSYFAMQWNICQKNKTIYLWMQGIAKASLIMLFRSFWLIRLFFTNRWL